MAPIFSPFGPWNTEAKRSFFTSSKSGIYLNLFRYMKLYNNTIFIFQYNFHFRNIEPWQFTLVVHMDWSNGWKSLKQNPSFLLGRSISSHVFNKMVPTQWLLCYNNKGRKNWLHEEIEKQHRNTMRNIPGFSDCNRRSVFYTSVWTQLGPHS